MPQQIATTPEQSRRLLACGVSADTADMCWYIESGELNIDILRLDTELIGCSYDDPKRHYEYISAWSLSALLGLLPKEIYDEDGTSFYFSLAQEYPTNEDYNAAYKPCWDNGDAFIEKRSPSPFEACAQLVECLAADGYKLNKPQKD